MVALGKLIEKLKRRPPEAEFDDIGRLLEKFGYERTKGKGSHVVFRNAEGRMVTVITVNGRKVKRVYVNRVLEFLGIDEEDDHEK